MKPVFTRTRIYSWHSWLGLVTGVFMALIGFSGAIAVFKHEIDWLVTPSLRVAPQGPQAGPDALWQSLSQRYPGSTVQSLGFPPGSRSAYTAYLESAEKARLQVHLDPHTAAVLGEREIEGTAWSLANVLRQFHVRLLMGFWGRVFVGVFGVTLVLSCLTGLYVYRNWIKTLFRVRFRMTWRIRISDAHKSIGLASLVFNLLIGATGAVLGLENLYGKIRYDWMGGQRESPPRLAKEDLAAYGPSAQALPPSRLLEIARARFPDMLPSSIQFPGKPGTAAVVRGDHPGVFIARGASQVAIDPYGGRILRAEDARIGSLSARVYDTIDPLHFGYFGARLGGAFSAWCEYAVKLAWFILGMAPGVLALSGFWLWYTRKRPSRPSRRSPEASSNPSSANAYPSAATAAASHP